MHIRPATHEDVPALAAVYEHAARTTGPERYTPEQVAAWAAFADEGARFEAFVMDAATLVAEIDGHVVGFGGLAADGHLTALYVHGDYGRRGIGSALMEALLDLARERRLGRLYTEASHFSRPLFERFGFTLYDVEHVDRRGVHFERYLMEYLPPGNEQAPGV